MDAELTAQSFSAYLKDLGSNGQKSKKSAFNALRLQLYNYPSSQKTLDECLLIGLSSVSSQNQHISHVITALQFLLQMGAKWDNKTLLDMQRTPYHIICQCASDPYKLLDKMIRSSGGKLVNETDCSGYTAVMYAVNNKNIKSLRCLIDHGADLNVRCNPLFTGITTALIDAIRVHALGPSTVTRDIFNLLLKSGADVIGHNLVTSPIEYAIHFGSIECFEKLVQKDAQFDLNRMWFLSVANRNIDILESLIQIGISKNVTDSFGRNALHLAVYRGHITVIRYLLEVGVTITTNELRRLPCSSRMDTDNIDDLRHMGNPCLQAISMKRLDIVQLLEKYDQQMFQSIEALKCAVYKNSLKIVNYLLSKYTYPLNMEYRHRNVACPVTIITEVCIPHQLKMVTLLTEHGADPAYKGDKKRYVSAFQIAISHKFNELVAHFIRSGVNVDDRLCPRCKQIPFVYAVIKGNTQTAEMLLHAGCSVGELLFTRPSSSGNINPLRKLMIEWEVYKNKVKPLQKLCRKSILNHLCPRAVKKVTELPLPPIIIRYLSIPELEY